SGPVAVGNGDRHRAHLAALVPAGAAPSPASIGSRDLLDTEAVPKGVTICNVFGHEPAIAEYVIMTMLALTHRLFETVTAVSAGSWVASPTFGGGHPHGEVMGRTIGIIGYGRIGREVAERAAGIKCRVLAPNRTPVAPQRGPIPFFPWQSSIACCRYLTQSSS